MSRKKKLILVIIMAIIFAIIIPFIQHYVVKGDNPLYTKDVNASASGAGMLADYIKRLGTNENGYTLYGVIEIIGEEGTGYSWDGLDSDNHGYTIIGPEKDENFAVAAYLTNIGTDAIESLWGEVSGSLSKLLSPAAQEAIGSIKRGSSNGSNQSAWLEEAKRYAEFCKNLDEKGIIEQGQSEFEYNDAGWVGNISLTKLVKDTSDGEYQFTEGTKNKIGIIVSMGGKEYKTELDVTTGKETGDVLLSTNGSDNNLTLKDLKIKEPFWVQVKGKTIASEEDVDYIIMYDEYQLFAAIIPIYKGPSNTGPGKGWIPKDYSASSEGHYNQVIWKGKKKDTPKNPPTPGSNELEDFALRKGIASITHTTANGGGSVTFTEEERGLTKKKIGNFSNFADVKEDSIGGISKDIIEGYDGNPWYNPSYNPHDKDQNTVTYEDKTFDKNAKNIQVKVGDTIKYTIRVYNEGKDSYNGPAVIDYIPAGLKLAVGSEVNTKYKWKYVGDTTINGVVYKKYSSDYLAGVSIEGFGDEREGATLYEKGKRTYDLVDTKTDDDGETHEIWEWRWHGDGKYKLFYDGKTPDWYSYDYVGTYRVFERKSPNIHENDLMSKKNYVDIEIECVVDKEGNGSEGYLYNIAEIAGLSDRDSKANSVGGSYNFATGDNSIVAEDDDDWDGVHKMLDICGYVFLDGQMVKDQENYVNGIYDLGEYPLQGIKVELYKDTSEKMGETETDANGRYEFKENIPSDFSYYVKFTYNGVEYIATYYTHGSENENRDNDGQEDEGARESLNNKFSVMTYELSKQMESDKSIMDMTAKTIVHNGAESTDLFKTLNLGLIYRTPADVSISKDVLRTNVIVNGKEEVYTYSSIGETAKAGIYYDIVKEKTKESWEYDQDIYYEDVDEGRDNFAVYVTYRIIAYNESSTNTYVSEIADYFDSNLVPVDIQFWTSSSSGSNKLPIPQTVNIGGKSAIYIQVPQTYLGNNGKWYFDITFKFNNAADVLRSTFDSGNDYKARNEVEITKFETAENTKYKKGVPDIDSRPGNYIKDGVSEDDNSKAPIIYFKRNNPRIITGSVWEAISDEIKDSSDLYKNNQTLLTYVSTNGIKGIKVQLVEVCSDGTLKVKQTTSTDASGGYKFTSYIPGNYVVKFTYGEKNNHIKGTSKYTFNGKEYTAIINNQNYQSTQANPNENVRDPEGYRYWYVNSVNVRYSDASDEMAKRMDQINSLSSVYSYEKSRRLLDQDAEDFEKDIDTEMVAYTGLMQLEVEKAIRTFPNNNIMPMYVISNIDFGVTPRTEIKLSIEKYITHIKLTLSDGTVQIDADVNPTTHELTGKKIKGITYIPESPMNEPYEKIELEDELIQGATLQIKYNVKVSNNTPEEALTLYKNKYGDTIAIAYYKEPANKLTAYEPMSLGRNSVLVTKGLKWTRETDNPTDATIVASSSTEVRDHTVEIAQLVDHSSSLSVDQDEASSANWNRDLNNTIIRIDQDPVYKSQFGYDIRGETTCTLLNRPRADVTLKGKTNVQQEITMTSIIPQANILAEEELEYYNEAVVTQLGTNVGRVADLIPVEVKTDETRILDPTGVTEEPKTNYYAIIALAGAVLAIGIVLIKIFVLKKKEE